MRGGQLRAGRPPRHRVAGRNERKTQGTAYGVCAPEARFIFPSLSPPSPPSSSSSKRSWAGHSSPAWSVAQSEIRMRRMRRRSLFKFSLAVGNDGNPGMRGGQLRAGRPPRHRVAGRNERKTQGTAYGVCAPEARFIFPSLSPPSPPSSSSSKRSWAGQTGLRSRRAKIWLPCQKIRKLSHYTRFVISFNVLRAAIPQFLARGRNSLKLLQIKGNHGSPITLLLTGCCKFRGRGAVNFVYSCV
jgi:hypothetical protein